MNQENENLLLEPKSEWGGLWTEKKLEAFSKYVWSYLTIMNKYPHWKTIYFDGFAGSGNRKEKENTQLMLDLEISEEEENVYRGAAERVLSLEQLKFDYHYFIDLDKKSLNELKAKLTEEYSNRTMEFRSNDANEQIVELAKALHTKKYAALVFLDPFGMQINWESIAQLKDTRSDVWILVPTGVVVNRLLDRRGELKSIKKLESFFGLTEDEIRECFYEEVIEQTLFGEQEIIKKVSKPIEKISDIYVKQMKKIWNHVTEKPLVLTNSKGVPIFHFIFASNNKSAIKIGKHIIQNT